MSLYAEDTGTNFKPIPPGLHLARCYRIIDLGTQKSEYEGSIKFLRKVQFTWEAHGDDDEGNPIVTDKGEPMVISKDYTLSWGDKATLRIDLQSWRGKPFSEEETRRFDLKTVLDKWCMVNVQHKPKKKGNGVYANVTDITPVPTVIKSAIPKGHNKCEMFIISEPDMEMFDKFPDWLKKKIGESPEWKARQNMGEPSKGSGFDDMGDDMPF